MSDSNRELTALHGSVLLNGRFSRDNSLRDVLEIVTSMKDVEFGVVRILSKDLRGYFGVSRGATIVGGHTTSSLEYGIPALKQLLEANAGMFLFVRLDEFPLEIRQSLTIPLQDLLSWRPEGVPPNMVPLLSQALAPYEGMQDAFSQGSECMDALRTGKLAAPMDAQQEANDFQLYWDGNVSQATSNADAPAANVLGTLMPKRDPAKQHLATTVEIPAGAPELPAAQPEPVVEVNQEGVRVDVAASWLPAGGAAPVPRPMPRPMQQSQQQMQAVPQPQPEVAQDTGENWTTDDLNALAFPSQQEKDEPEAPKLSQTLTASGRFRATPEEGNPGESGRFHREDILAQSGRFRAMELAHLDTDLPVDFQQGVGASIDARSLMVAQEKPRKQFNPVVVSCVVLSVLLLAFGGWQSWLVMTATVPSPINVAADEIRNGQLPNALKTIDAVLAKDPNNGNAHIVRAVALLESKKHEAVIKECNSILESDKHAVDALRLRGIAYAEQGKFNQAIADANAYLAATKDGGDARARSQALAIRAFANMQLKKLDASLKDYDEAIKLDDKNMRLFASRAIVRNLKKGK